MELQDFAPQLLYSQFAFAESQSLILDRRGVTTQVMREHLKLSNVTLHPTAVEVASEDNRQQYRIGIAQTYASIMGFDDFADATGRARGFLDISLRHLENPDVAALNIRTYDIAPADSFEELRDALRTGVTPGASGLLEAVGVAFSDIGWVFEFKDEHSAMSVQFGPMESEQLKAVLRTEDAGEYPANALFLGVDTKLRHRDGKSPDALEWWERSVEANRRKIQRIGEWLREMVG